MAFYPDDGVFQGFGELESRELCPEGVGPDGLLRYRAAWQGVWAPSIRYHEGEYYIYWGDPDFGVYMVKAEDPAGEWSEPVLVKAAKGIIDPCPLWDDDGKCYLAYAWAGSRAQINSVLCVAEMNAEGTKVVGPSPYRV